MQTRFSMRGIIVLIRIALLLTVSIALNQSSNSASAQSGGGYALTWNTIDGGGAMFSTGGTYSLGGTISQPDAGTMSGGG